MGKARICQSPKDGGKRCQAAPLHDSQYCVMHSPEHAQEMAEARRLGGLRRRKEQTVSSAFDFEGLDSSDQVRRVIEIAVLDTLAQENSNTRSRTLGYLARIATQLLETREFEQRLEALEETVGQRSM